MFDKYFEHLDAVGRRYIAVMGYNSYDHNNPPTLSNSQCVQLGSFSVGAANLDSADGRAPH